MSEMEQHCAGRKVRSGNSPSADLKRKTYLKADSVRSPSGDFLAGNVPFLLEENKASSDTAFQGRRFFSKFSQDLKGLWPVREVRALFTQLSPRKRKINVKGIKANISEAEGSFHLWGGGRMVGCSEAF